MEETSVQINYIVCDEIFIFNQIFFSKVNTCHTQSTLCEHDDRRLSLKHQMADDGGDEIIDELEKEAIEREEILKNRKTRWEAFVEVYYSRDDLNTIAAFDKRILERVDMLTQDGRNLARIFTILMSKMHKDDLKYVITLVDQILRLEEGILFFLLFGQL